MENTKCKANETVPQILEMCSSCFRVKSKDDRWLPMGEVSEPLHPEFSDGLCPDCCKKRYLKEIKLLYF